jgi:hypothetical protein
MSVPEQNLFRRFTSMGLHYLSSLIYTVPAVDTLRDHVCLEDTRLHGPSQMYVYLKYVGLYNYVAFM